MKRFVLQIGLILASLGLGGVFTANITPTAQAATTPKTIKTFPKKMRGTWYYRDGNNNTNRMTFTKHTLKKAILYDGQVQRKWTYRLVVKSKKMGDVKLAKNGHGWYTVSVAYTDAWTDYKRGTYTIKGHKYAALYTGAVSVLDPVRKKVSFDMAMHKDHGRAYTKKVSIKGLL